MRTLWIFAGVYILTSAVACQPLRNAKGELELSRRSVRTPSSLHDKPPRQAFSKVRRRYSGLTSATEDVSEFISRITNRVRGSKTIAETNETKLPFPDGETSFQPSPAKTLDLSHGRPQPIRRPVAFGGNEAGYFADLDRDHLDLKRYERLPLVSSLVDQSASRQVDHAADVMMQAGAKKQTHLWNDPKQRPKVMIGVAASATIALLLAQNIRQNQETTQNLNAALASSQAQQQQAAQQAVSDNVARAASGSPRSARLRRRRLDFSSDDHASGPEHASQPVQHVHLQKRFDPIRSAREYWQRMSLVQGYRNSMAALRNLPEDTKGLIAKYAIGAAAMLTTGFALLYCYYKGRLQTQPASAPEGSPDFFDSMPPDYLPPPTHPRNQTNHNSLQKRIADPQKEHFVASSPPSGRDAVKDRQRVQINKRLVSPAAQTIAMENEMSLGSPHRTLENVHPDVRQTMDLSEKVLREKGPLALLTLSVALTALLTIELKRLVHIYQEETKESSMQPSNKLRHLGQLQAQDTTQALAGAHDQVNVASMRRLVKRMAPIEEANEEGTMTGTTPALVSLDSSAQQSHPVAPRALDRADEAMLKWGPIAISAIVLAGLAFIGFESYKIHQYQHERASKNDRSSANKVPSTPEELVKRSALNELQEMFAESTSSHAQESSPYRHLSKRMAPAQLAAETADTPSASVDAPSAEDQLHPRTRLLVALSRESLKKTPIAAVTLVATAFAVTAAAAVQYIRHHHHNWKSGEEPNLHSETSMTHNELVKRFRSELQRLQDPSSPRGQVESSGEHLSKRMFQMNQLPPMGHRANLEQQMASATVVPIEGEEPAAVVHATRHISPETMAIFGIVGVVATSAGIGGLYTLFHHDFDKAEDTQHAMTSSAGRKPIRREADNHSLPQTQQHRRVDLHRRGLFLPGTEDIIEDAKFMLRGARRERVGPEVRRLGGGNDVQQRQPWMLVLTLMGLATVVVPLAAAGWSWERSRARRQVESLEQSEGDADKQPADTVEKKQVRTSHLRRSHLGKRNVPLSGVTDAIIEEMRLLPRIRGRRPNRPSPSIRRETLRHRQGELLALGIAVTAAGASGLTWLLPHKSHEEVVKQWEEEMQRRVRADQITHHKGLYKRALTFADVKLASEEATLAVRMTIQRWRRAILRRRFGRRPALPVQYLGADRREQPGRIAWKTLAGEVGPAIIGAALGGTAAWYLHPKILAAEERIARKRREKAQAAALTEELRIQREMEQQGPISSLPVQNPAGSPLSRRSITQMTERVKLAMDDIQSYASSRPLSPMETEARAKRTRQYAVAGVSMAAMEAIKTYLLYALIKSRVEKKERKRIQDEWRQQQTQAQQEPQPQQMQSSRNGPFVKRDRNPSAPRLTTERRALRKRTDVVPVAEDQMAATREADIDPRFLQRIREGKLLAKDLVILGAAIAATIGLTCGVAYLVDKKDLQLDTAQPHPNFNMHAIRGPETARYSSHVVKRANVLPVAEVEMAATQEADIDPRFLERIRRGTLLAQDIAVFGAVAAVSFGFSFGLANLLNRKDRKQDVEQPHTEHSSQSKGKLDKRADVQPVEGIEMAGAREADTDPRVEQRLLVTRNVVALATLFATLFAVAVGITYWTMNHGKPDKVPPPDTGRGHGLPGPLRRKRALADDTDQRAELATLLEKRAQVSPLTEYTMRNSQETRVEPRFLETMPRLRGIDYGDALLMMWGAVAVMAGPITLLVKEHQERKAEKEREERRARAHLPPAEAPMSQRNPATQAAMDQNRHTKRADVVPALEAAEIDAGAKGRLRSGHKDLAKGAAILLSIFGIGGIVSIALALKERDQNSRAKHGDRSLHKRAGVVPGEEGMEAVAIEADHDPRAQEARRRAWQTTKTIGVVTAAMAIILGSVGGAAYEISKHLPQKNATEAYAPLPHINSQQMRRSAEVASVMLIGESRTPHDPEVERNSLTTPIAAPDVVAINAEASTTGIERDHRLHKRADPEPAAEVEMAAGDRVRVDDLQADPEAARQATWRFGARIAAYAATTLAVISTGAGYVYYTLKKGMKGAHTDQPNGRVFNGDEDLLPPPKHLSDTRRIERRDLSKIASIGAKMAGSDAHSQQNHKNIVERANAEPNVPMGALVMRVFRQFAIDSKRAGYSPSASSSSSSSSAQRPQPAIPAKDDSETRGAAEDPGLRQLEAAVARDLLIDREHGRRQRSTQQRTLAKRETYLPNQSRMPAAIIGIVALVVLYKVKNRVDDRQHDASSSYLAATSFGERRPLQQDANGGMSEQ
ncbi:hypothetical protein PHSY_001974 [Pseudozyma hubeiensis SY62]|uniref:Transmembrane protein n=1 Tax=Pseudozyma hubeiensis (strain SY62) TaxID=1305764 RepID=R9NZT5_PSEHS|nr:hypothetical protein PHSY_001974 [Pseudozyma hubeiensis SY62]GAC94403.1 hypothetical protein PHSY_001974 [Pseudozyma hubeiensis SY62]